MPVIYIRRSTSGNVSSWDGSWDSVQIETRDITGKTTPDLYHINSKNDIHLNTQMRPANYLDGSGKLDYNYTKADYDYINGETFVYEGINSEGSYSSDKDSMSLTNGINYIFHGISDWNAKLNANDPGFDYGSDPVPYIYQAIDHHYAGPSTYNANTPEWDYYADMSDVQYTINGVDTKVTGQETIDANNPNFDYGSDLVYRTDGALGFDDVDGIYIKSITRSDLPGKNVIIDNQWTESAEEYFNGIINDNSNMFVGEEISYSSEFIQPYTSGHQPDKLQWQNQFDHGNNPSTSYVDSAGQTFFQEHQWQFSTASDARIKFIEDDNSFNYITGDLKLVLFEKEMPIVFVSLPKYTEEFTDVQTIIINTNIEVLNIEYDTTASIMGNIICYNRDKYTTEKVTSGVNVITTTGTRDVQPYSNADTEYTVLNSETTEETIIDVSNRIDIIEDFERWCFDESLVDGIEYLTNELDVTRKNLVETLELRLEVI